MNADITSEIVLIHGLVPAKASRHNAEKFPGAPGWEEVADYALDWALQHGRRS